MKSPNYSRFVASLCLTPRPTRHAQFKSYCQKAQCDCDSAARKYFHQNNVLSSICFGSVCLSNKAHTRPLPSRAPFVRLCLDKARPESKSL